ncbi:MAG TPA: ribonuclease Z [Nocardioides sp.]|uniref:ribonuclease Z n=1 Tax=Nocardioides sp. TaxID=35761 RepID=UPI002ED818CC
MTDRELIVLGTASQVPTRTRAHQGTVLRWGREVVLFDPGEGTQRQLTLAGISAASITRICLTHLHGDHCLGLPGVLQRMVLDGARHPVSLYFPASGQEYVDRLRQASASFGSPVVHEHPVSCDGLVEDWGAVSLHARALDHRIDAYGWRLEEPDGVRFVPARLAELGIAGPAVGLLSRQGWLDVAGRRVTLAEVSEPRPGQAFAFVMDTRLCRAAVDLAAGVDLLVCESTYVSGEEALAEQYAHLTAAQAATIARDAGARRLVLTHYSGRHPDESVFAEDAARVFPHVHAARDLDRIPVPSRR